MKARKARLAALFLSAMMAVTYSAPYTYADEIVADDGAAAVEFAADAEDGVLFEDAGEAEAPAAENQQETKETGTSAEGVGEVDEGTIEWMYPEDGTQVANYTAKDAKGKDVAMTATTEFAEQHEATCTEDAWVILKFTDVYGKEHKSKVITEKAGKKIQQAYGHTKWENGVQLKDKDGNPISTYEEIPGTRVDDEEATHLKAGTAYADFKCSLCGDVIKGQTITVPKQDHVKDDTVYKYENWVNIKTIKEKQPDGTEKDVVDLSKGEPVLKDDTKGGQYDIVWYCVKPSDDETSPAELERKTIYVESEKTTWAQISDLKNINTTDPTNPIVIYDGMTIKPTTNNDGKTKVDAHTAIMDQLPAKDTIELTDCTKDGSYKVTFYDNDGAEKSHTVVTVKAHDMLVYPVVEFTNAQDAKDCKVEYSKDGKTYTITNKSCYRTAEYQEVIHCNAKHCSAKLCDGNKDNPYNKVIANPQVTGTLHTISVTKKTVEPTGDHKYDTATKKAIANAQAVAAAQQKENAKKVIDGVEVSDADLEAARFTYEKLEAAVKASTKANNTKDVVLLSADTSTCTEGADITVTYLCLLCKGAPKTETVHVDAKGHDWEESRREDPIKKATCTSYGEYQTAIHCKRCDAVKDAVVTKQEPMLAHTNDLSRDDNGVSVKDFEDTLNAKNVKIVFTGDKVVDSYGRLFHNFDASNPTTWTAADSTENYIGDPWDDGASVKDYGLTAAAVSVCDTCGAYEVKIQKPLTFKILAISKQNDKTGAPGSITVEVTYKNSKNVEFKGTTTVPYWTDIAAYESRTVKSDRNGLAKDDDGQVKYFDDDKIDTTKNGFVTDNGDEYLVVDGVVATGANGLTLVDGKWYYLNGGRKVDYTGVTTYNDNWFYVTDGKLDTNINGLVSYNGEYFLFAAGMMKKEVSGLWYDSLHDKWYFLADGMWKKDFSGVTEYGGAFFVVKDGLLDTSANGTVEYNGATFRVTAGMLGEQVA